MNAVVRVEVGARFSTLVQICVGNYMCNLGIVARVTGKVIAQAIVSAIYACCDCNYSQIVREFM